MKKTSDGVLPRDADAATLDELLFELGQRLLNGESVELAEYKARLPGEAKKLDQAYHALAALASWSGDEIDPSGFEQLPGLQDSSSGTRTLGDYRLIRAIGRGGMGVVYKAEQISLGRTVALKILPFAGMLDERQLIRFKNEARAAATLDHPHIVSVYAIGQEAAVHFYAMQFIEGQSMAELIEELRELNEPAGEVERNRGGAVHDAVDPQMTSASTSTATGEIEAAKDTAPAVAQAYVSTQRSNRAPAFFQSVARLGLQAAEALQHAHAHGVLHRDIKPANLMIDKQGELLITDFGLARLEADAGMTMTGDILGTLRYMSPEQARAERGIVDHRSDIYSLGATLYEFATLRPVFTGHDRQALLNQIALDEPVHPSAINPSIPRDLATIILKAIRKTPDERYATAQDLADDLRRFLAQQPIHAKPATRVERAFKWSLRHRSLVLAATAAVLLVAVTGVITSVLLSRAYLREAAALETARANYQAGRTAIDALTGRVLDRLSADEAMRKLGRSIIGNEPLEFYESVLQRAGDASTIRSDAAWAALSLGKLQRQLGKPQESRAALQYARQQFGDLHQVSPEDEVHREGRVDANVALGDLLLSMSPHTWSAAISAYEEAMTVSQPWLDAPHANPHRKLDAIAVRVAYLPFLRASGNTDLERSFRESCLRNLGGLENYAHEHESNRVKAKFHSLRAAVANDATLAHKDLLRAVELAPDDVRYQIMLSGNLQDLFARAAGNHDEQQKWNGQRLELMQKGMKDFPWVSEWRAHYAEALVGKAQLQTDTGVDQTHQEGLENMRAALAAAEGLASEQSELREYDRLVASAAMRLGMALLTEGKLHDAAEAMETSRTSWLDYSQQCPQDCGAITNRMIAEIGLMKSYSALGDQDEAKAARLRAETAVRDIEQVEKALGDPADIAYSLAKGHWLLQEYERAIEAFAEAHEHSPDNARICYYYASSLIFGKPTEPESAALAKRLAKKATVLEPGVGHYRTALAAALYRNEQWQAAIEELSSQPPTPLNRLILAMCHWRLGDETNSREHFSAAMDWFQSHESWLDLGGEFGQLQREAEILLQMAPQTNID